MLQMMQQLQVMQRQSGESAPGAVAAWPRRTRATLGNQAYASTPSWNPSFMGAEGAASAFPKLTLAIPIFRASASSTLAVAAPLKSGAEAVIQGRR